MMEQQPRRRSWVVWPMIAIALLGGILIGKGWERTGYASETYEELKTFSEVLNQIQRHYVDETKPKELIQGAIRGMLATLDPHSAYMTPEMYKEMQVETKGEFGGVGIQIGVKDNRLAVIAPIEGTPAHRAGIKAGDFIVKVNDETTKDLSLMDAVQKMRGPKGSKVSLTVQREGTPEPLVFTLVRDTIKIESVKSKVIENNLGYVRLTQFQESTGKDLAKAIKQFKEQKVQGVIIDLRNNPGGLLTAAVDVSEQFLPSGKLIVYTKSRDGKKDEWFAKAKDHLDNLPLIVLVNEGSASASEIVAGALQDWGRAVVVGTTSFGKGSVQTILALGDGSGLRLTTAKYYTPKGRTIQSTGITPDIVVKAPQPVVAKATENQSQAGEKDSEGKGGKSPAGAGKDQASPVGKSSDEVGAKTGTTPPVATAEAGTDLSIEEDVQLQKAVELLKTWKIFKELKPS
ncbi:Carboxy-terminal-processing protease [Candidatus Nitrospira inopinata]|uniref:Carboxy-terminal-processing protease n=2 Tax=Candidatus Nitrospira inopinata TaxID=1715989 RepID=A0A0S4L0D6_9BACT|nr:Carboxy-terminal-processing protease [Candidatus Nitrospira inopinata]